MEGWNAMSVHASWVLRSKGDVCSRISRLQLSVRFQVVRTGGAPAKCACIAASIVQARPAQGALHRVLHTSNCTRPCCDGASASALCVHTSSDARNAPRNVHTPTLAFEGCCVTDPTHPRRVYTIAARAVAHIFCVIARCSRAAPVGRPVLSLQAL